MSDWPEDIKKVARGLAAECFVNYFDAPGKIADALVAERERCAAIARKYEVHDEFRKLRYSIAKEILNDGPSSTQKLNEATGQWEPAIPEPYYHGLFSWAWLRITGHRDEYGRKAQLLR